MDTDKEFFYVVWYTDNWYEVEEGWCVCFKDDLKQVFANVKTANPRDFLHIQAFKFELGVVQESTSVLQPDKEFKR